MVKASSFTETMRRRAQTCLSNLETLTSQQDVYICPKCGEVHVVLPEDADHPVNSSRTVGTSWQPDSTAVSLFKDKLKSSKKQCASAMTRYPTTFMT